MEHDVLTCWTRLLEYEPLLLFSWDTTAAVAVLARGKIVVSESK
jgi:hypothetical protein